MNLKRKFTAAGIALTLLMGVQNYADSSITFAAAAPAVNASAQLTQDIQSIQQQQRHDYMYVFQMKNAMMQMTKYGGEALLNGIIYVTASPCELCAKKLYQIGVRKIVYIDPYPGISRQHIISSGFKKPALKLFQGAYGTAYFKLYQPFMSYKDEICIRTGDLHEYRTNAQLLNDILKRLGKESKTTYTQQEYAEILNAFKKGES